MRQKRNDFFKIHETFANIGRCYLIPLLFTILTTLFGQAFALTASAKTVATWQDIGGFPFYSFFDGTTWSTPAQIPTATVAAGDVINCFNPVTMQTVATWEDNSTLPFYSIYNGTSWSTGAMISAGSVSGPVFTSFYPPTGQIIATWQDLMSSNPFYSFFNGTSWSTPTAITNTSQVNIGTGVSTSFNAALNQIVATWHDVGSGGDPFYSIYNGTTWSAAAQIPGSDDIGLNDVFNSYNPALAETIATLVNNIGFDAESWLYNGAWSGGGGIPSCDNATPPNCGFGVGTDVYTSYNPVIGQTIATGVADKLGACYSFYNGASWTAFAVISPGANSAGIIFTSFNPGFQKTVATWSDAMTFTPLFSLFDGTNWSTAAPISAGLTNSDVFTSSIAAGPSSPSGLSGKQKVNDFAVVSERFNKLSWQQGSNVTYYELYRNGELIATLKGTAHSYEDHDQPKHSVTYSLIAVNDVGSSSPAIVTVGG